MKKHILFLILSTFPFYLKAQHDTIKNSCYVSINGGYGMPIGKFGETLNGAYAVGGGTCTIEAYIPIKKTIYDLTVLLSYNSNAVGLQELLGYPTPPNPSYALASGDYVIMSAMVGLDVVLPQKERKVNIILRLLVGPAYTHYPFLSYETSYTQNNQELFLPNYINPVNKFDFALFTGICLKLSPWKRFFIEFNADYMITGGTVKTTDNATNISGNVSTNAVDIGSTINLFNLTAGIGYRLGK